MKKICIFRILLVILHEFCELLGERQFCGRREAPIGYRTPFRLSDAAKRLLAMGERFNV